MLRRTLITEDGMLRKSPALAKTARIGHPTSKAHFKGKEYGNSVGVDRA